MKYKKYHYSTVYRGYQANLICCATSYKKAAEMFDISEYTARNYALCTETDDYFEGVRGYLDSGYIIFEYGRKDLSRKEMAWDDLKVIIDEYVAKKHEKTWGGT